MKNKWMDNIRTAADFIEHNVRRKLTLDEIAAEVGLSKYHFHRIMSAAAERPLMDYVRARKLASSLDLLLHKDMTILDIALEFGFEFEQSYINAFTSEYGVTPYKFKKGSYTLRIAPPIDVSQMKALDEGIIFKPQYAVKTAFTLAGVRHRFSPEENYNHNTANAVGNDFFYRRRQEMRNPVRPDTYIGFTKWTSGDPDSNSYMPSVEMYETSRLPEGWDREKVAPHRYAVFKFIGQFHPRELTYHHLEEIWAYINETWMNDPDRKTADTFFFEQIDMELASDNYCEVELYIPISINGWRRPIGASGICF
ncbi:AraC family transcriptional regulator [Paenibacillus elgii]|uniref:AraC family transcriptional regulator n=1 Tax=Paenibacillus elgii TaxID=189691 RepID=UPI0013D6036B|nr:helix-turn-helix domain-containing protein [Paenibacillus elgii]